MHKKTPETRNANYALNPEVSQQAPVQSETKRQNCEKKPLTLPQQISGVGCRLPT
jgi:hypothetical protein